MQITGDFRQMYNKSFQRLLLAHLVKDRDLFDKADELEVADFETAPCQVVWEATKTIVGKTSALPANSAALSLACELVAANESGEYVSFIKPEEDHALKELISWINTTDPVNSAYFVEELPDFIKGTRTSKIMDEGRNAIIMGGQADMLIDRLTKLKSEIDDKFADTVDVFMTAREDPGFIRQEEYVPPIPTGIPKLDSKLGGGANLGEVCLVQAPSGVGKTNILLSNMLAANYFRFNGLFFSLELSGKKVRGRFTAMASGFEAENLKVPVEQWDDKTWELAESSLLYNPVLDRATFIDFSTHKPTTTEIEKRIVEWKARGIATGIPEEMMAAVYVDWIDYIRPPFVTKKNMEDWERYIMVAQELGFIARRQNVNIWIANQTTKEAERRSVMRMGDTARGYHLHDAMDLSIGANIHPDDRPNEEATERSTTAPQGFRKMSITLLKNRNGDLGHFDAFRAPTLRMFDSEEDYYNYKSELLRITGSDSDAGASRVNAQLRGLVSV